MDLESAQRVANLETANPGFKYQLVKQTVLEINTPPSVALCDLTLPRVGLFRAERFFKVAQSTGKQGRSGATRKSKHDRGGSPMSVNHHQQAVIEMTQLGPKNQRDPSYCNFVRYCDIGGHNASSPSQLSLIQLWRMRTLSSAARAEGHLPILPHHRSSAMFLVSRPTCWKRPWTGLPSIFNISMRPY